MARKAPKTKRKKFQPPEGKSLKPGFGTREKRLFTSSSPGKGIKEKGGTRFTTEGRRQTEVRHFADPTFTKSDVKNRNFITEGGEARRRTSFSNQRTINESELEFVDSFIPGGQITDAGQGGAVDIELTEKSFITRAAEFGVTPAVIAANAISDSIEFATGGKIDFGNITAEQFAGTPYGRTLGLTTVVAETILGAVAAKRLLFKAGSKIIAPGATTIGRSSTGALTGTAAGRATAVPNAFKSIAAKTGRFANNPKSKKLTAKFLLTAGLTAGAIALIGGAFGTYPFAAWAKQEALGGLKVNSRDARQAGDLEMAERMIAMREEIADNSWWIDLPYKNVIEEFNSFFAADKLAIESEKRLIAKERGELEFETLDIGEKIAKRDKERDAKFAKFNR